MMLKTLLQLNGKGNVEVESIIYIPHSLCEYTINIGIQESFIINLMNLSRIKPS